MKAPMRINTQLSVDATEEQKKRLNAMAKKYDSTVSYIVRMMIDYSIDEIERRLSEAHKALAGSK